MDIFRTTSFVRVRSIFGQLDDPTPGKRNHAKTMGRVLINNEEVTPTTDRAIGANDHQAQN